jgi:uncharacterized protein YbcC (UPF0753/DUF2309 family)
MHPIDHSATTLMAAADIAARAIPPAFPLDATVAVNPFLGQTEAPLATAAARLARVAGVRITRPRAEYAAEIKSGRISDADLVAALAACPLAPKPADLAILKARLGAEGAPPGALPTVADLVGRATGTDWPMLIARNISLWASGHFDRGQALWTPASGRGAFAAWRDWASHDLTPEIAGLSGFCAHVAAAPDTSERAILRTCTHLGLTEDAAGSAFHRLMMDMGGWSQHARWILWQAELAGGTDTTLTDLLAIRLVWEEALLTHAPQVAPRWAEVVATHATPLAPDADQVLDSILQEAAERAHQRRLAAAMTGPKAHAGRPALQAAFCIDVRSEVYRRALESVNPGITTHGFAGFFGLPLAHRAHGTEELQIHLPVLLNPGMTSSSHAAPEIEQATRIAARTSRAWGRFRNAAVSSFAFVEAAGPVYGWKLVKDALALGDRTPTPQPKPFVEGGLTAQQKADTAAAVLKAMSLTQGHARLVLLLGHGGQVTNNPHESAYHCGACAGQTGEVSARLLAQVLNDPEARAGLAERGVNVPDDTRFVAGLHDTTTDTITLYRDLAMPDHAKDITTARQWLARGTSLARSERALRLPGASGANIATRSVNWAEVRPEWALAGCAAFIAAPRAATLGADLGGRAFLHDYDWRADEGFGILELILTAPVVVASWISLQYYGSSLAPTVFGGGNKLIHNVVGGIGVVQGNGGLLRPGLPWQAVHDGNALAHEPLRLSVLVAAPRDAMADVLARHDGVRALFDNTWLHLLAVEDGQITHRYRPGLEWEAFKG